MVLTVGKYTVAEHEDVVAKPNSRNHDVAGVRSRIEGGKCQWGGLFARSWIRSVRILTDLGMGQTIHRSERTSTAAISLTSYLHD